MILIVCALIAVATVPLTGASLRPMAALPIRHLWLVWLAIGLQTALVSTPWHPPQVLGQGLHIVSYVMAGLFAVSNRAVPGVPLISAGGLLNAIAIFANGGIMPATPSALHAAGIASDGQFTNSGAVSDAHVQVLGDMFAIPAAWPLSNVFSIGDIVVVIGIAYLAHRQCRHPAGAGRATPVEEQAAQHAASRF